MRRTLSIFLFLLLLKYAAGQPISRYNTFSYNVNEGLLQSTIADIAVDKHNFCWISFPNGIQQFDGTNFSSVKLQPGLPDDKFVKFLRCANGELLVSHARGISLYKSETNGFVQVYQQPEGLKKPVIFLGEDAGYIYFIDETALIHRMRSSDYQWMENIKSGLPAYATQYENIPVVTPNVINHRVAFWINTELFLWDLREKKLRYRVGPIRDGCLFILHLKSDHEVYYTRYSEDNFLQCWDFEKGTNSRQPIKAKDISKVGRLNIMPWRGKTLMSVNNRLYETSDDLTELRSEIVNFHNQPIAGTNVIASLAEDNFGNLCIQTVSGGIRRVIHNNYPVKYFGTREKESNSVTAILPDKRNNRLLVGGALNGLLIFDTLQQLVRHIPRLPGEEATLGISAIIKDMNGDYLCYVVGSPHPWRLSADLNTFKPEPVVLANTGRTGRIDYFGNSVYRDEKEAIVHTMYKIYRTEFSSKKTTVYHLTSDYLLGSVLYGKRLIAHANDELIFAETDSFKIVKRIPFPNTDGVRCLLRTKDGLLMAGTNNGIFQFDTSGRVLRHWTKANGLPDDCIYAIAQDENGSLWCSSNKGIFRINAANKILQLVREDGLQENEFNTNVVARAEDGELFFGGVNGVSSFFPDAIGSYSEQVELLLTRIRVNNTDYVSDSATWKIDNIRLPYHQNSLSFDFIAMASNNPAQYTYQYRMLGIDKDWIQNSGIQTVRYSLPPGKYTLQLYASRVFDNHATPMKEIRIIIQPPFWKTWWFRIGLITLLVSLLYYGINQRSKRQYAKKLQQLENERQIKLERERISKDLHDSLGAYANAVLYNAELLEKEQTAERRTGLISDMKFASKDIITSLRETVWALKQESYTAEECLVRVRNFIQPLVKFYQSVHFSIEGDPPAGLRLHSTQAFNLVRIIQEAISNSLKHANPTSCRVRSEPVEEGWKITISDDGKGFDYATMKDQDRGNGLNNIEQRASESGFSLSIRSAQNQGTHITIIL